MSLIYKTLFEIRLHHEYFLTKDNGTTIFEKNTPELRDEYLKNEYNNDQRSLNDLIDFKFPEHVRELYAGLGLKVLPIYSGCRVVARVLPKTLSDNSRVFETTFPISKAKDIFILINDKTSSLERLTNSRVKRAIPGIHFFTNVDVGDARVFPFLTNPVPSRDPLQIYEQGELSASGGLIQEYYSEAGVDKFQDVTGTGFSNESDRILIPTSFEYRFADTLNLTEASFTVTDFNGTEVATIVKSNPSGLKEKVTLDLSSKIGTINAFEDVPLIEKVYQLKFEGNNGTSAIHRVLFSDQLTNTKPWAVIAIKLTPFTDPFSTISADGYLIRRKDPGGVEIPAPIFEIPIKSRLAYWRFKHDKSKELTVSPSLTDYLNKEGDVLVTKKPRSISRSWFFLRKDGSADTEYVPNPTSLQLKIEQDRRLFFEILVPQSDLFPIVP